MKRREEKTDSYVLPRWIALRSRETKADDDEAIWSLVEWLNTSGNGQYKAKARIKLLIGHLQAQRFDAASAILNRYRLCYDLTLTLTEELDAISEHWATPNLSWEEIWALHAVTALVERRRLGQLVTCAECGAKWIFRRRRDQRYCSEECRQAPYERSEKRKAQKAEAAKRRYHDPVAGTGATRLDRRKTHGKR